MKAIQVAKTASPLVQQCQKALDDISTGTLWGCTGYCQLHFDQTPIRHGFPMLQRELLNYNLNKSICILSLLQLKVKTFTKCVLISINFFVQKGVCIKVDATCV